MGQLLSETWKILGANGPTKDLNSSGLTGIYIDMKFYESVCWIINLGTTHSTGVDMTLEESTDASGAGTAVDFRYRKEDTDSGDTLEAWAASSSATLALSTNDDIFYVVERAAWEMSDGKRYVRLLLDDPGGATVGSITALVKPKYAQNQMPSTLP